MCYVAIQAAGRMASWTDEETLKLIEVWGEESIQAMLEGSKRNKEVFKKIAREMEAAGYEKTAEQCNSKIKLEYRKIKDTRNKTGRGRKEWKCFESMDAVLGHKPATQPPVVVESGDVSVAINTLTEGAEKSVGDAETCEAKSSDQKDMSRSRSETPTATTQGKGKKRKRSSEKTDRMEILVDKILEMQSGSEQHYLKVEEKMMEIEEQRQRESQAFQLQLMTMLCNQQGRIPQPSGSDGQHPGPSNSSTYPPMYSFMPPPNNEDEY